MNVNMNVKVPSVEGTCDMTSVVRMNMDSQWGQNPIPGKNNDTGDIQIKLSINEELRHMNIKLGKVAQKEIRKKFSDFLKRGGGLEGD